MAKGRVFQSTCPRGARRMSNVPYSMYMNFNPRARVGHDWGDRRLVHGLAISIHVPAWGTT